jgi:hypothetical protein
MTSPDEQPAPDRRRVRPYAMTICADGTRIWSLMQLERQLRPEVYGRRRGGFLDRRRLRQ